MMVLFLFCFLYFGCQHASCCFLLQHSAAVFGWKSGSGPSMRSLLLTHSLPLGDRFFTALTLPPLHCDLVWSRVSSTTLRNARRPFPYFFFCFSPFHPSTHPSCDLFAPQRPSRPSSKHASASTSPSTSRSSLPLPSSGES